MPRVGSSMISTFGSVASHLPSTTFCWLPPESVPTGASRSPAFRRRRLPQSAASVDSLFAEMRPCFISRPSTVSDALRAMLNSSASPCARRSSGTSARPARTAAAGLPDASGLPAIFTSPASTRIDAEDRPRDFAAPRADESRQRDDLARVDIERYVLEHAIARESTHRQAHLAARDLGLRIERVEIAADHLAHDRVDGHVGGERVEHLHAIAHDGHALRQRKHFVEPVRDEENRDVAFAQRPHDRKEALDFGQRKRGRRFVHDQHVRIERQRLGNLDHLLVRDRQAAHEPLGAQVHAERREQAHRLRDSSRRSECGAGDRAADGP